jgi:hypothetical protein
LLDLLEFPPGWDDSREDVAVTVDLINETAVILGALANGESHQARLICLYLFRSGLTTSQLARSHSDLYSYPLRPPD